MKSTGSKIIEIGRIDPGKRLRDASPEYVELFIETLRGGGFLPAIQVAETSKGNYRLIAGYHRLVAHSGAGIKKIAANVFKPDAELAEEQIIEMQAAENLHRNELTMLDRAIFLSSWKRVYEKMNPETKAGVAGANAKNGNANDKLSFAEETEKKLGIDKRTIQRAIHLADNIPESLRPQIRNTPLENNQAHLAILADQEIATQAQSVEYLNEGKAKNIKDAIDHVTGNAQPEKSPLENQVSGLKDKWASAGNEARKQFIAHLQETGELEAFNGR